MTDKINLHEDICTCGHLHSQHYFGDSTMDTYCQVKNCGCRNFEAAQDKQEPKNPYPEPVITIVGKVLSGEEINELYESQKVPVAQYEAWNKCAEAYQPRLAALQQRVKELEENLKLSDMTSEERMNIIIKQNNQISTLESQLKNMVELDENQKLPAHPSSGIFPEDYHFKNGYDEAQQDMLKSGFRKVKALASQESKGGTK